MTCADVNDDMSLITEQECGNELAELPIDVESLCGCSDSSPPAKNAICPAGQVISTDRSADFV
mgnify:CR=1 FL=1